MKYNYNDGEQPTYELTDQERRDVMDFMRRANRQAKVTISTSHNELRFSVGSTALVLTGEEAR